MTGCVTEPPDIHIVDTSQDMDASVHVGHPDLGQPDTRPREDADVPMDTQMESWDAWTVRDGQTPDDTGTGMDTPEHLGPAPVITELMFENPDVLVDANGSPTDWIEIFNPHPNAIDLSQFTLIHRGSPPQHWPFPTYALPPGAFLLLFASGTAQEPAVPPFHTHFTLADSNGYLAVSHRNGSVIQEMNFDIEMESEQSHGIPMEKTARALIEAGDSVRYRLPSDGSVDLVWYTPEYDDRLWAEGVFPVGHDGTPPEMPDELIAGSVQDWSENGQQGHRGWTYGYWNRSEDADDVYAPNEFLPFPRQAADFSAENFWDGTRWRWFDGNPPWTSISSRNMHPNGENNGHEHWPIRRWEATRAGPLIIDWRLRKADLGSSGLTGYVMHNGQVIDEQALDGRDGTGIRRDRYIARVARGDMFDFAVSPIGPAGDIDDFQDRVSMIAEIYTSARLALDEGTSLNVVEESAIYLRAQFDVERPLPPGGNLVLRVQYDDGLVVYFNGAHAADENSPDMLSWNVSARADKPNDQTQIDEQFILDTHMLREGDNHIAFHVLPGPGADQRSWILPTLEYVFPNLIENDDPNQPGRWKQRRLDQPTPGEPNLSGRSELPPN